MYNTHTLIHTHRYTEIHIHIYIYTHTHIQNGHSCECAFRDFVLRVCSILPSQKSEGLLEMKCGKFQASRSIFVFLYAFNRFRALVFSTVHLQASQNIGSFCFPAFCWYFQQFTSKSDNLLFFCIFHMRFVASLVPKSPEQFFVSCILLLSVSDFPKDSEVRL